MTLPGGSGAHADASYLLDPAGWEAAHPSGEGWNYYECWLRSLERVVSSTGLVTADDLRARLDLLAERPAGHDHHHDHEHDHE